MTYREISKHNYTLTCQACSKEYESGNATGKWCEECRDSETRKSKTEGNRRRRKAETKAQRDYRNQRDKERKQRKRGVVKSPYRQRREDITHMMACPRCGEKMPEPSLLCGFCREEEQA